MKVKDHKFDDNICKSSSLSEALGSNIFWDSKFLDFVFFKVYFSLYTNAVGNNVPSRLWDKVPLIVLLIVYKYSESD